MDSRARAEAWAIERMVENHFGFAVGYTRFLIPENFAKGPAHFVDYAPEGQREQLREELLTRVKENFLANGILRHTAEEIEWLGMRSLGALSNLLGEKPYLMGDKPTAVDAISFGMLAGLLTPFFNSDLRRRALQNRKSLRLRRAHDGGVLSGIRVGGGGVINPLLSGRPYAASQLGQPLRRPKPWRVAGRPAMTSGDAVVCVRFTRDDSRPRCGL